MLSMAVVGPWSYYSIPDCPSATGRWNRVAAWYRRFAARAVVGASRRRLRGQPQVRQNALDHRWLFNPCPEPVEGTARILCWPPHFAQRRRAQSLLRRMRAADQSCGASCGAIRLRPTILAIQSSKNKSTRRAGVRGGGFVLNPKCARNVQAYSHTSQ